MATSGLPFPVPHNKLSLDIKGNKTDLVICSYDEHFLVIATQIGSMGTILHARKEEGLSIHPTFHVSVIFGKRDEPMLVACARRLIEHLRVVDLQSVLILCFKIALIRFKIGHGLMCLHFAVALAPPDHWCSLLVSKTTLWRR
ncbi:hypothetical protein F0562_004942 [Nyssa sinensis]|uniref:Uncharacterized protein n=1 Tax=Nyssa sinensis TaxID=561372 RepID=A0A5J5AGU7_9ASTE|nr:hypothetical protein F0562_004942 [Nyssa sinensis]